MPTVVGPPQTGKLLTATAGAWTGGKPVAFTYAWGRCDAAGAGCTPIANATKVSYTPVTADVGHALVVTVTAQTASGTATATSAPTLAIAGTGAATAPKSTSPPKITGTAQVGQTLAGSVGTWTGSPTSYAYQWRRCGTDGSCAAIAGASASSYPLTPDDIGATILLVVTATSSGGSGVAELVAELGRAGRPAAAACDRLGRRAGRPGGRRDHRRPGRDRHVAARRRAAALDGRPRRRRRAGSRWQGSSFTLALSATPPLRWPVDLQYAAAPPTAVPGFIGATGGVWQAVTTLPSSALPAGQELGAYRDIAGALHVLLRRPGRIALFEPDAWGDPRFASIARPRLTLVSHVLAGRPVHGAIILRTRFTLDSPGAPGGDRRRTGRAVGSHCSRRAAGSART